MGFRSSTRPSSHPDVWRKDDVECVHMFACIVTRCLFSSPSYRFQHQLNYQLLGKQ
jgi:hypothetical protein